jgi:hypothetical protein
MVEINTELDDNGIPRKSKFKKLTVIDPDTVQLNDVDSSQFSTYKSGGYLMYYTPVDLTGYTARMTIKDQPGGTTLIALVSPTDIVMDTTLKTITITITATAAAAFAPGDYVYDMEMVSPSGVVTALLQGAVQVLPEVTT